MTCPIYVIEQVANQQARQDRLSRSIRNAIEMATGEWFDEKVGYWRAGSQRVVRWDSAQD